MHRTGCFYTTARRRKWTEPPKGGVVPLSNVLMNGGCLYVPDEAYNDFLAVYAQCIEAGESLYVVERPSVEIRFYADFDIHVDVALTLAEVDAYVDGVASTFATSAARLLETESPTVVLCAEPKALHDDDASGGAISRQKIGVHLVMPRTRVSAERAMELREGIIDDLRTRLDPPRNGWDDAFDASVYHQGGLRMVGSRKMTPCSCAASQACPHAQRKVDAGRPYLLRHVLDARGGVDPTWTHTLRANAVMRTMMSSIRLPRSATAAATAAATTAASRPVGPSSKRRRRADAPPRGGGESRRPGAASSTTTPRLADVVLDDAALAPQHRDLQVRVDGSILRVVGDGDRYCPNVGRHHSQSTVYLVVAKDGVAMRCHCKKGDCPSYRGPAMALSRLGAQWMGHSVSDRGLPPGFE